jgi:hypothetical protein
MAQVSRYENFFHSCVEPDNPKFAIEKRTSRYDVDLLDTKNLKKVMDNHLLSSYNTAQNFTQD